MLSRVVEHKAVPGSVAVADRVSERRGVAAHPVFPFLAQLAQVRQFPHGCAPGGTTVTLDGGVAVTFCGCGTGGLLSAATSIVYFGISRLPCPSLGAATCVTFILPVRDTCTPRVA